MRSGAMPGAPLHLTRRSLTCAPSSKVAGRTSIHSYGRSGGPSGDNRAGAPAMTPENEEKMVVARRYLDLREAEFALSVLHGHDVDAFIDVPYTASMFPQYMFGSS